VTDALQFLLACPRSSAPADVQLVEFRIELPLLGFEGGHLLLHN
jgi:hypothetical protein